MNALDAIMEAHSGSKVARTLYAAYSPCLHALRMEVAFLRRSGPEFAHEADCLESQARSAEQTYARMMREALKREGGQV